MNFAREEFKNCSSKFPMLKNVSAVGWISKILFRN